MELKYLNWYTIVPITDQPEWMIRLQQELINLDDKIFKLNKIIYSDSEIKVSLREAREMFAQLEGMEKYITALSRRCKIHQLIKSIKLSPLSCDSPNILPSN